MTLLQAASILALFFTANFDCTAGDVLGEPYAECRSGNRPITYCYRDTCYAWSGGEYDVSTLLGVGR